MKMKFHAILLALLLPSVLLMAQKPEEVLFTVGEESISRSEFEYVYSKNNGNADDPYSPEQIQEYLDLYVIFKLKVKEAYELGIDTTTAFKQEFEQYRQQLMKPYLSDKGKLDELVNEAYERLQYEVNASHILINTTPDAPPADTLIAYNLAMEVYQKAKAGSNFDSLALTYSQDPSAEHNNGELGYFTAFQMIYPFETTAYNLNLGEISPPVRTQFGYHIVKLNAKRETRGEVEVAHIMVRIPEGMSSPNNDPAKNKIDSIYRKLVAGADFEAMAIAESEDATTARKGGRLPRISSLDRRLPSEFIEASFALDRDGKLSEPFKTQYGWHILKRISHVPFGSKEDMYEGIVTKINRDSRADAATQAAIGNIKKANGFKEQPKNLTKFRKALDSSFVKTGWAGIGTAKIGRKPLFTIGNLTLTGKDFSDWIVERKTAPSSKNIDFVLQEYYKEFRDEKILTYERENLETKYPEYRHLVKEYKEGILLFEVTDKMVWSKAINDSGGLANFYEHHKQNYSAPERVEAEVFETTNAAASKEVMKLLRQDTIPASKIALRLNDKFPATVTYYKKVYKKGDSELIDDVGFKKDIYSRQRDGKHFSIRVSKHIPEGPKPFEEIRGMVISDYQEQLESEWIESLRTKYPVHINREILTNLFK